MTDTTTTPPEIGGIGHSVERVEDARLIEGQGNFLDDIALPGMLHMALVRSPAASFNSSRPSPTPSPSNSSSALSSNADSPIPALSYP